MADLVQKTGTPQISFADHPLTPSTANVLEVGTPTDVQITLANLSNGAARQSNQVDLGATRAAKYNVIACLEFAVAPTVGAIVELYWAPSGNSTAANGNPGGVSGSDAAYTGDSSNLDDAVKQLYYIGPFVCTEVEDTEGQQIADIGILTPKERYGTLVVKNESGQALHSDDVEMNVVFNPIVDTV
jgi:hypothetical protein